MQMQVGEAGSWHCLPACSDRKLQRHGGDSITGRTQHHPAGALIESRAVTATALRTSASSVLAEKSAERAWMMGWSGLISRDRLPLMYSADRLSDIICADPSQLSTP